MADTRFVFVHYHILKNAGSTIEWVLEREFGVGFASWHGASRDSILDGTDLAAFLGERPDVTAISSHHLHYPKPVVRGTVIFDCCFLRHPLDRLVSLYTWAKRGNSSDAVCRAARAQTPREFARYMLHELPHMVSNVQVTHIANGSAFCRPANEQDLDLAAKTMMEMAVPGLVELFDESLIAAEYFLHPAFPNLRLDYEQQNVSRPGERHRPEHERTLEDKLIGLWGAEIYADLHRLNQLDLELWNRTRNEIRRRVFLVPGLRERMADFQARCGNSRKPAARVTESVFAAAS